jgi:hypothetical protein
MPACTTYGRRSGPESGLAKTGRNVPGGTGRPRWDALDVPERPGARPPNADAGHGQPARAWPRRHPRRILLTSTNGIGCGSANRAETSGIGHADSTAQRVANQHSIISVKSRSTRQTDPAVGGSVGRDHSMRGPSDPVRSRRSWTDHLLAGSVADAATSAAKHCGWPQPLGLTPGIWPACGTMSYTIVSRCVASPLTPAGT